MYAPSCLQKQHTHTHTHTHTNTYTAHIYVSYYHTHALDTNFCEGGKSHTTVYGLPSSFRYSLTAGREMTTHSLTHSQTLGGMYVYSKIYV